MQRLELKLSDGSVAVLDAEKLAGFVMNPLRPREVALIQGQGMLQLKLGDNDDAKKLDAVFTRGEPTCCLHLDACRPERA